MALSKPGKSSSLSLFRNILVVLRIGILLGGAVLILIFLGSFLLDILFVPSSAVVRSGLAKFVHSVADPVVAALVSGVRINTRVRGTETMPLIITAVLFAVTAFLNGQAQRLLEWIEDPRRYSKYCDKNLQLLKILNDDNCVLVRGAVPGGHNEYVVITKAATRTTSG